MDKTDPPESFGVFKPVGHTLIAYRDADDLLAAVSSLQAMGFATEALVRYTPQQMMAQVDRELPGASPLAAMGQELNLIKAHRALAERGCGFLVVHAPDDALAERVAIVARATHAVAAQRYGRFIVEELIAAPAGQTQVAESPDRGLDLTLPGQTAR